MTNNDIKKIREMLTFLVKGKISERLKKLTSDEKKIYELIDKRQSDIIRLTGFSAGKISKIRQKLENEGILIKEGQKYKKVL